MDHIFTFAPLALLQNDSFTTGLKPPQTVLGACRCLLGIITIIIIHYSEYLALFIQTT